MDEFDLACSLGDLLSVGFGIAIFEPDQFGL